GFPRDRDAPSRRGHRLPLRDDRERRRANGGPRRRRARDLLRRRAVSRTRARDRGETRRPSPPAGDRGEARGLVAGLVRRRLPVVHGALHAGAAHRLLLRRRRRLSERFRRRPEDDLAGLSRRETLESLVEAIEGRLERDQGVEVDDAGLEEPTRLVPGLEDLAPVETEDGEVLEDDVLRDVELDRV